MSAKHTPGPWSFELYPSGAFEIAKDPAGRYMVIASRGSNQNRDEEMHANARLIAAAPDLLEALRAVVSVADRKTDEFDMARAAIAKATGDA